MLLLQSGLYFLQYSFNDSICYLFIFRCIYIYMYIILKCYNLWKPKQLTLFHLYIYIAKLSVDTKMVTAVAEKTFLFSKIRSASCLQNFMHVLLILLFEEDIKGVNFRLGRHFCCRHVSSRLHFFFNTSSISNNVSLSISVKHMYV